MKNLEYFSPDQQVLFITNNVFQEFYPQVYSIKKIKNAFYVINSITAQ